jgi:hypothetical protein
MPVLIIIAAVNLCGCIAAMATLAETAKAKQKMNVSYSDAFGIIKGAVKTIEGFKFESARIEKDIAEVKGVSADGKTVRIFVSRISDNECSISVRAGMTEAGHEDAKKILQAIMDYADLVKH